MSLRDQLLRTVLSDLPDQGSKLGEPDPRWDALLGGRTGPNAWAQYARGYGTTCIVALNNWASQAGFPDDMVIEVPTPNGGGTRMITAFNAGAKTRGWLHTPEHGVLPDLRPGDVYEINHATSTGEDGTHVGVVVDVQPSADGQSLVVQTADGGQGTRNAQEATRSTRTFSLSDGAHHVTVKSPYSSGWLDRWVSVGGDEPLEVAGNANDTGTGGAPVAAGTSDNRTTVAVTLLGAGLLLSGLAFYVYGGRAPGRIDWLEEYGVV